MKHMYFLFSKSYHGSDPVKEYCLNNSTPLHPVQTKLMEDTLKIPRVWMQETQATHCTNFSSYKLIFFSFLLVSLFACLFICLLVCLFDYLYVCLFESLCVVFLYNVLADFFSFFHILFVFCCCLLVCYFVLMFNCKLSSVEFRE